MGRGGGSENSQGGGSHGRSRKTEDKWRKKQEVLVEKRPEELHYVLVKAP